MFGFFRKTKTPIQQLKALVDIQCQDGNWNYDPYMQGMANGMILALTILDKDYRGEFKAAPSVWLKDVDQPKPIAANNSKISNQE